MTETGEIVKVELEAADILNSFFANIINNFKNSRDAGYDSLIDGIENHTIKALLNTETCNPRKKKTQAKLYFKEFSIEDTQKEIIKVDNKKVSKNSGLPTKIKKENADNCLEINYIIFKRRVSIIL